MIRSLVALMAMLLTACEPEATPFPADAPDQTTATPTSVLISEQPAALFRYALAPNTAGFVADLALIEVVAQVEPLQEPVDPADLGVRYDLVVALGDIPGGTRSPTPIRISLVMNPNVAPLNNEVIRRIISQSVDSLEMVSALDLPGAAPAQTRERNVGGLRVELANAGWPDGFDVILVYANAPGANRAADSLAAVGITVRLVPTAALGSLFERDPVHLALIAWSSPDERAVWVGRVGEANIVELVTIPISYLAVAGSNLGFTPGGWPLPNP